MAIITLTTDWNYDGFYISTIKGFIVSQAPEVKIIDLSHSIPAFSVVQAAFLLRNSFRRFPEGSIHIIGVLSEATEERPHVLVKHQGHYFISADNGIFGLLLSEDPELIIELPQDHPTTFPECDVFAAFACRLANGENAESLGTKKESLYQLSEIIPTLNDSLINGKVIHIDSFGNAISNIDNELFNEVRRDRRFEIFIQSNAYKVNKISTKYVEVPAGELLAVFNSCNLLEVAINQGNIAELLNLNTNSIIRVKFYDS